MKRKISIAVGDLQDLYGDMRALEIAAEIGADAVDFDLSGEDYRKAESVYSKGEEEIIAYYTALYEKAQSLGIEIAQTHGRIKIYYGNAEDDAAVFPNARLDCLATRLLHAPCTVMHGVTTGVMGADAPPERMHALNYSIFSQLLDYAREFDVKIATETFGDSPKYQCCDFFGNADEFEKAYNRICADGDNTDYFVTCIDTGHSNKAMRFNNNPKPGDVIRRMGKSIACLHLNDNDTLTDQHMIPRTGTIDWKDIFDALDEIGYSGIYNMELNLKHFGGGFEIEMAAFAVKVMRYMLNQRYGEA